MGQVAPSRVGRSAASQFPEAAAANKAIFFDKSGRARSVQEVYGVLAASHADEKSNPGIYLLDPHQGAQPGMRVK